MSEPQSMRVVVTLEVVLKDRSAWTETFGVEGAQNVRDDVKAYVRNLVGQAEVFTNGEVEAEVRLVK